jgi:hypothetical protein
MWVWGYNRSGGGGGGGVEVGDAKMRRKTRVARNMGTVDPHYPFLSPHKWMIDEPPKAISGGVAEIGQDQRGEILKNMNG